MSLVSQQVFVVSLPILDTRGNGIDEPGYYLITLNGVAVAGKSRFGYYETTKFFVEELTSPTHQTLDTSGGDQIWDDIMEEDFKNGLGLFND